MSRELEYYHKNKEIINNRRRLKYMFETNKISKNEYEIELSRINLKLQENEFSQEILTDIMSSMEDCNITELLILKDHINLKIKEILTKNGNS